LLTGYFISEVQNLFSFFALDALLEVQNLTLKVLFFEFTGVSWMVLCAISQFTYFTASYTGRLDRVLANVELSQECANYCRRTVKIYVSLAWSLWMMNFAFMLYSIFFSGGYMDHMLYPITIYVNESNLLVPRIVMFSIDVYLGAAWTFPHAMSLMLAAVFSHQYKELDRILEQRIADIEQCRVSDLEIETLRMRHQKISIAVAEADKFLKFSNAGAFCCQLFGTIMLLYALIFYRSTTTDAVVIIKRVFWLLGQILGLSLTTVGGISHVNWNI